MKRLIIVFLCIWSSTCLAQEKVLYKQIDTTSLYMDVYYPEKTTTSKTYPAIAFFFGGGWTRGSKKQFKQHAQYFSKRGLVCFLIDYRIKKKHGASPFKSLEDAKSAIRFIRENAKKFSVNPNKIVAAGGSAGGHLAAATALITKFNSLKDNLKTSCIPNALILFNPIIDNSPGGYGFKRIGEKYKDFSPLHNIKKGAPPTLILVGTKDKFIPTETVMYYKKMMEKVGSICELKLYKNQEHGFFNYNSSFKLKSNFKNYKSTLLEADNFLQKLKYISSTPKIRIKK